MQQFSFDARRVNDQCWLIDIYVYSFVLSLQARLFDEPQLASLCLDTIDKSTADAINAEGFTDIDLGMWAVLTSYFLFYILFGCEMMNILCFCMRRHLMCSATKRYTQHQGEPSVWGGGTLGRGRVLQTTASFNLREQTESSGESPSTHPLPVNDGWRVCCR